MKKYQITNVHDKVNIKTICIDEFGDPDVSAPQSRETALFDTVNDASDFFAENNLSESDWIIEGVEIDE